MKRFQRISAFLMALVLVVGLLPAGVLPITALDAEAQKPEVNTNYLHASYSEAAITVDGNMTEAAYQRSTFLSAGKLSVAWDKENLYVAAETAIASLQINGVAVELAADAKEAKIPFADVDIIDLTKIYAFSIKIGTMETAWDATLIFDAVVYSVVESGKFNLYFGAEVLDGNKVLFNTWEAAGAAEATEADRLYDCALTAGTSQTDLVVSYVTPTVVEMDLTIDKLPAVSASPFKSYGDWGARQAVKNSVVIMVMDSLREKAASATTLVTGLYNKAGTLYLVCPDSAKQELVEFKVGAFTEGNKYHLRMEYSYRLVGETTVADVAYYVNGEFVGKQEDVYKPGFNTRYASNNSVELFVQGSDYTNYDNRAVVTLENLSSQHANTEVEAYKTETINKIPMFHSAFYGKNTTSYERWDMPVGEDMQARVEWDWNNLYVYLIDNSGTKAQSGETPTVRIAGKTFAASYTQGTTIPWSEILGDALTVAVAQTPSITFHVGDWLGYLALDTFDAAWGVGKDYYRFNDGSKATDPNGITKKEGFDSANRTAYGATSYLTADADLDMAVTVEVNIVEMKNGAVNDTTLAKRDLANGVNFWIADSLYDTTNKNNAFTVSLMQIEDVRYFVYRYTNEAGNAAYGQEDITALGDHLLIRAEFDYNAGADGVLDTTDPVAAKYYINGKLVATTNNARANTGTALPNGSANILESIVTNRAEFWLNHLSVANKDNAIFADRLVIENAGAETVENQIAALPAVGALTLDDKAAVEAAREAYNALPKEKKDLVSNLSVLEAAETEIQRLWIVSQRYYIHAGAVGGIVLDGQIESSYRMNIPFTPTTQMGAVWDLTNLYLAITGEDLGEMTAVAVDGKPLTAVKGAGGNEYAIPVGTLDLQGDKAYTLTFTLGDLIWNGTLVLGTNDYTTIKMEASAGATMDATNRVAHLDSTTPSNGLAVASVKNYRLEGLADTPTIFEFDVQVNAMPDTGRLNGTNRYFCQGGLGIVFRDQDPTMEGTYICEAFMIGLYKQNGVMKLGYWDNTVGGYVTVDAGETVDGQYHVRVEFTYPEDVLSNDIAANYYVNGSLVAQSTSAKQSGGGKGTGVPLGMQILAYRYNNVDVKAVVSNVSVSHPKGVDAVAEKLAPTAAAPQTNILLQPGANKSEMNFTWFSQSQEQGVIKYAKESELVGGELPENAASVTATRGDYDKKAGYVNNKATITDLKPDTTYYYQLINGNDKTELKSFKTGADGDFSFAFVGDPQIGGSGDNDRLSSDLITQHLKAEAEWWGMTLDQIKNEGVDFIMSAGDQTDTHAYNYWDKTDVTGIYGIHEQQFDAFANQDVLQGLPIVTVTGNHDDDTYPVYADHVNVPNMLKKEDGTYYGATYTGGTNFTGADYYFTYNNVLFLVLNANTYYHDRTNSDEHLDFIDRVINEETAGQNFDWIITLYHESPYGSSYHQDEDRDEQDSYARIRSHLVPKLYEAGVDLVLSGHDHCYTRTHILKPGVDNGGDSYVIQSDAYNAWKNDVPIGAANVDGMLHVVGGTGSGSQVNAVKYNTEDYKVATATANTRMMTKIEVTGDTLTLITYNMGTGLSNNPVEIDRIAITNDADATVEAAIDAIGTVTVDSEEKIDAARAAYDALSPQLKKRVANYQTLVEAEAALVVAKQEAADREAADKAAADAVIAKINAIGTVTLDSVAAIQDAETAYAALTQAQKDLVTNYATLEAARNTYNDLVADKAAADAVIAKINAIGTVTLDSVAAIQDAETAYAALTQAQKDLVTNYATLTAARTAYDKLVADKSAADPVIAQIEAIGTVTLDSKTAIEDAETAHAALTEDQKTLVTNYNVLTAARATYNELRANADKAELDQAAANEVMAKINAIGAVTLDSKTAIEAAEAAYAALTPDQKALVTNYDVLTVARATYNQLAADKAAADAVIAQIDAIDTVTLESKAAIETAETAYEALTPEQKALVTNRDALIAARTAYDKLAADKAAADPVIAQIEALGTVTLDSKTAIEAAEAAYEALTQAQKDLVTNYATLTAARTQYNKLVADKAAADAVIAQIDAIGTVTLESKAAIEVAENSYTALTAEQKALVTNYGVLTAARASYNEQKAAADKAEADQAAANGVIAQIDAIGTVTLNSKAAIEAAEAAYETLTPDQKALVTNYTTLTAARATYDNLKAAADQAAADAVIAQIDAIGTVTLESKAAIEAAEAAYEALTAEQKALVTNYNTLTAARASYNEQKAAADKAAADQAAADAATDKIEAIGTVTLESKTAIEAARAAYEALTADQKTLVGDNTLKTLTDAEAALEALEAAAKEAADKAAADAVIAKIDAIGTVTLESKTAIEAARAAYNALTAEQKTLVKAETLKKLTDAEAALKALLDAADKETVDQAAAKAAADKINAIGTVTLNSQTAIKAARAAYDALTAEQKALVSAQALKKLTDAEAAWKALQDADVPPKTGDTAMIVPVVLLVVLSAMGMAVVVTGKKRFF